MATHDDEHKRAAPRPRRRQVLCARRIALGCRGTEVGEGVGEGGRVRVLRRGPGAGAGRSAGLISMHVTLPVIYYGIPPARVTNPLCH